MKNMNIHILIMWEKAGVSREERPTESLAYTWLLPLQQESGVTWFLYTRAQTEIRSLKCPFRSSFRIPIRDVLPTSRTWTTVYHRVCSLRSFQPGFLVTPETAISLSSHTLALRSAHVSCPPFALHGRMRDCRLSVGPAQALSSVSHGQLVF